MKNLTFNEFCQNNCDRLYEPRLSEEEQCTGYTLLKKMVMEDITPASLEEIKQWESKPNFVELMAKPDIKYLRFLHPLLRPYIIENWGTIRKLRTSA